jgi:methionine synthase II (cobalamin-independent)
MAMKITRDISIEDLVDNVPQAVKYLMQEGIKCIECGEPIWGTLEDAAKEKGYGDKDIDRFVKDLQAFADNPSKQVEEPQAKVDVKKMDPGSGKDQQ